MELHPILERDVRPQPNWWYVMSVLGEGPSMRVGHSATFISALHADEHDRVFIIGGANPDQVFSEVFVLDLDKRSWDTLEANGFKGRYEHAAFHVVETHPEKIFVFGGATQSGNLNDIQSLNISTGVWSDVDVGGTPPTPRTHHSCGIIGPKAFFYSGGQSGSDPVGDKRVHCFDTSTMSWSVIAPSGESPKPRHGHLMVAHGHQLLVYGGMSGATFYDDLFKLDLKTNSWSNVKKKKTGPLPRAAHGGVVHKGQMLVFGGMNKSGALSDSYMWNTENNSWSKVKLEGPAPPNRLDFAVCLIRLSVPASKQKSSPLVDVEVAPYNARVQQAFEHTLPGIKDPKSAEISIGQEKNESNSGSPVVEISSSPGVETSSSPGVETSSSPGVKTSSSPGLETSSSPGVETISSPGVETSSSSGVETSFSPGVETSSSPGVETIDTHPGTELELEHVSLMLVHGGMDTMGEIFDDTLVFLLG